MLHLQAAAVSVEMMVQDRRELSEEATIKEEFCFLANELKSAGCCDSDSPEFCLFPE